MIDLDIRAFFDSIPHELLLKAVSKHTNLGWVLLYVRRWLEAPLQREDGTIEARDRGNSARVGGDSPNAIANFDFEVALPYRRGEKIFLKPRRRSNTLSDG